MFMCDKKPLCALFLLSVAIETFYWSTGVVVMDFIFLGSTNLSVQCAGWGTFIKDPMKNTRRRRSRHSYYYLYSISWCSFNVVRLSLCRDSPAQPSVDHFCSRSKDNTSMVSEWRTNQLYKDNIVHSRFVFRVDRNSCLVLNVFSKDYQKESVWTERWKT